MVLKKYIKGIAILVLFLSLISVAFGIAINTVTPAAPDVPNFTGDTNRFFEVTTDHSANFTWKINGSEITTGEVKGKENSTRSNYTNISAGKGFWNITVIAVNTSNPFDIKTQTWNWNVIDPIDITPPPSVTGLTMSKGATWIRWSWTNPPNPPNTDFNHTYIKINNTFQTNISNTSSFYNHTGLIPGTLYTISLQTVDTSGNMNQTPVTDAENTYNTPAGPFVNIALPYGSINFSTVTSEGDTNATTISSPGPLNKLKNVSNIVNIITSATTTGNIIIGLNYNPALIPSQYTTADVDLYHWNSTISSWENITSGRETNKISGIVSSPLSSTFMAAVNDTTPPANITGLNYTVGYTWINWNWNNPSIDFDHTEIYFDGTFVMNKISNNYNTSLNTTLNPKTSHNISLRPVDASGNIGNWTNGSASTIAPPPRIVKAPPLIDSPFETSGFSTEKNFTIQLVEQSANITWNSGTKTQPNNSMNPGDFASFNFKPNAVGVYNISVSATNENGTATLFWNWTVHPKTYAMGNRIWDGGKPAEFGLTYTWSPQSFSGFYYDANDDVGTENIQIKLNSYSDRLINKGDLTYTTAPEDVKFAYSQFGNYSVVGFMADKYFAGYTDGSLSDPTLKPSTNVRSLSVLAQGQLHKVLMDDDTKRTVSIGSTLTLQEGYVLKAKDVDAGARTMLMALLKDGNEIDSTPLTAGQTYVYTKRVGSVSDLPLIIVRFDSVFAGQEVQAAFIKGLFQISENPTTVRSGDTFGKMQVGTVSVNQLQMTNNNDISLSKGTTQDVMGNVKILVADNDTVRYALSVDKKSDFEVRSTVYTPDNGILEWTPYNFGMNIGKTSIGFYYDLDDGIGSEKLNATLSGKKIEKNNLVYSTSPQEVKFTYSDFGTYNVVGFMADKYFAGYTANSIPSKFNPTTNVGEKSALSSGQLHKVLIDDDTKRTVSIGSTLTLQDGYVLKAKDIDAGARTMLMALLKDGNEIDTTPLTAGQTYVYAKRVGGVDDLPIIIVRFESVFAGQEVQAAFLRGMFQISETPTTIKSGDTFGKMEVTSIDSKKIEMSNNAAISLDRNQNNVLMGNIKLKVADSNALRFYFAVDVTPEMVANQLVIDAPQKVMAGDEIKIKVTAGGKPVEGAVVTLDTEIGKTDRSGLLNYTLPKTLKGIYNLTANMMGYDKATRNIEIEKYIDLRLTLDAPAKAVQFDTISIKILYNGSTMNGATVKFDNQTLGVTDNTGILNYTLQTTGTHVLSASKTSYVSVSRDIDIVAPFSDFKAIDLNVSPASVFTDEKVVIKTNITNAGNKKDTLPVELMMNGSAVSNVTLTLGPGDKKEINFTRKESKAGNYTFEIAGQKGVYVVKDKPLNLLLVGGILTLIGIGAIYVLTAKGMINIDLLKEKFNSLIKSVKK